MLPTATLSMVVRLEETLPWVKAADEVKAKPLLYWCPPWATTLATAAGRPGVVGVRCRTPGVQRLKRWTVQPLAVPERPQVASSTKCGR